MLFLEMFSKTICLTESNIGLCQILTLFPKCGIISVIAGIFRSRFVPMTIVRTLHTSFGFSLAPHDHCQVHPVVVTLVLQEKTLAGRLHQFVMQSSESRFRKAVFSTKQGCSGSLDCWSRWCYNGYRYWLKYFMERKVFLSFLSIL